MMDDRLDADDLALPRHADELPSIQFLRDWARGHVEPDAALLDDDEILHRWRAQDRREARLWEYNTSALARGQSDPLHDAVPLQSLAATHRIGFVVLDGAGKPFGKLAFVLHHRDRELERGALGSDATVRRADVTDDDYTLQLVDVDAVTWGSRRVCLDEPTTLHVRASGLDGHTLEVRLFEELRERDEDVLATASVTVHGGVGVVAWTPVRDHVAPDRVGGAVPLVAEVRDQDGHWAKTEIPLEVELPAIAAAAWAAPHVEVGAAIELRAATRGFADGTALEFDVWRVDWSGDDVHVTTLDAATITAGLATSTWTPERPGEYWFSASVSAADVCTAASGLVVAT